MGRVGAAGDNAAMESFFALLQTNVLDRKVWATRDELASAVIGWIERTYHRRRRQRGLGKLTPLEFEPSNDQRPTLHDHDCHQHLSPECGAIPTDRTRMTQVGPNQARRNLGVVATVVC